MLARNCDIVRPGIALGPLCPVMPRPDIVIVFFSWRGLRNGLLYLKSLFLHAVSLGRYSSWRVCDMTTESWLSVPSAMRRARLTHFLPKIEEPTLILFLAPAASPFFVDEGSLVSTIPSWIRVEYAFEMEYTADVSVCRLIVCKDWNLQILHPFKGGLSCDALGFYSGMSREIFAYVAFCRNDRARLPCAPGVLTARMPSSPHCDYFCYGWRRVQCPLGCRGAFDKKCVLYNDHCSVQCCYFGDHGVQVVIWPNLIGLFFFFFGEFERLLNYCHLLFVNFWICDSRHKYCD